MVQIAAGLNSDSLLHDGHFGDAPYYAVYSITSEGRLKFEESRPNPGFQQRMHGDPLKARSVAELLKDVDVLLAHQVGPNVKRMKKQFVVLVARFRQPAYALEWAAANHATLLASLNGEGKCIMKV